LRISQILEKRMLIIFPFAYPFEEMSFFKLNICYFLHGNFSLSFIMIKL